MKNLLSLLLLMVTLGSTPANAQDYLMYVAVDPCRIVDTREAGGAIAAEDFRTFNAAGSLGELAGQGGTECLSPMDGQPLAVSAYVIAVPAPGSTDGVLTAYPADQLPPAVGTGSTVNFYTGMITGNTTNITLADGEFAILARNTNQHVVVDVQGYFYPAPEPVPAPDSGPCPASSPTRWVDNGDGTICDNQTGLMWEKKVSGDCYKQDVHCVYDSYTVLAGGYEPVDFIQPGSLYTIFLSTLNLVYTSDPNDTCFAGYCDWRIPTISELNSIVLDNCSSGGCIDPVFGPTNMEPDIGDGGDGLDKAYYWSSTRTSQNIIPDPPQDFNLLARWYVVDFYYGEIRTSAGWSHEAVGWARAVRAGR